MIYVAHGNGVRPQTVQARCPHAWGRAENAKEVVSSDSGRRHDQLVTPGAGRVHCGQQHDGINVPLVLSLGWERQTVTVQYLSTRIPQAAIPGEGTYGPRQ